VVLVVFKRHTLPGMITHIIFLLLSSVLSVCPIENKRQLNEIRSAIKNLKADLKSVLDSLLSQPVVLEDLRDIQAQIAEREAQLEEAQKAFKADVESRMNEIERWRIDSQVEIGIILSLRASYFEPRRLIALQNWIESTVSSLIAADNESNTSEDVELPTSFLESIKSTVISYIYRIDEEEPIIDTTTLRLRRPTTVGRRQLARVFLEEVQKLCEEMDTDFSSEAAGLIKRLDASRVNQVDIRDCISYI
jgi:hypothetical protein